MSEQQQVIDKALKTKAPKDVVLAFLYNTDKSRVAIASEKLVAEDAIYTSLNFNNPELKQIEPWAGTSTGRDVYIYTFSNVGTYWTIDDFQITDILAEDETVAVFGQFTYTSVHAKRTFTSPFSIKAIVKDGLITYFQFMEDTYASAASFRVSGEWTIQQNADPKLNFTVSETTAN
ncbi:nuclear transport factor 2 family protein [Acinetobacter sp. YH12239]|uniref:nuclear transport factor 2 family protein n=1 Tax=Acinetobacter sp. YH12239 TaxID=2601166 RepID=UPI0015D2ED62|nr:nuclear transport factor 2 family protein [Acinetobacter sp. YH12239]